mgnify:CR=1 FL=1
MSISGSPEGGGQNIVELVVQMQFDSFYSRLDPEIRIDNSLYLLSNQDWYVLRGCFRAGCITYQEGKKLKTDTNPYNFLAKEAGWQAMNDISLSPGI